jgi:hypothetical protein
MAVSHVDNCFAVASAVAFTGSSRRWAYLAVVFVSLCPRSARIIKRDPPALATVDAKE